MTNDDLKGKEFDFVVIEEAVRIDLPSHLQLTAVLEGKQCPYCWGATEYIDSERIYGRSYGMMYACLRCEAWVGVHHKTSKEALGRLADDELRKWKMRAHTAFDPIWKNGPKNRRRAYAWLTKQMGIPSEFVHIGMFNVEQCKQVVELCRAARMNQAQHTTQDRT